MPHPPARRRRLSRRHVSRVDEAERDGADEQGGADSALRRRSSRPHSRSTRIYRPVCRTSPRNNRPPGLSTRAISRTAVSRSAALSMLCSTSFVTITSNGAVGERQPAGVAVLDQDAHGHPSSREFSSVAQTRLPTRSSACQMSTPTAFPPDSMIEQELTE